MTPAKGSLSMNSPLNELAKHGTCQPAVVSKLNRENMIEQAAGRIYKNRLLRREIEIKEA